MPDKPVKPEGLFVVMTTIQAPTDCVLTLAAKLRDSQTPMIVIGDRKGPQDFPLDGVEFWHIERQPQLRFSLTAQLPVGHYARKNLGYLRAIEQGAKCIYETDDDNMPNDLWQPREREATVEPIALEAANAPEQNEVRWVNAYRLFTDELIWPRGLPLTQIRDPKTFERLTRGSAVSSAAPIQQGLADLAPDVDAIWRMTLDREFYFESRPSIQLSPGQWCPFNSQTTWWWPEAYPLLYLPSFCSFRMTDIWRSFVAQRCLWELGAGLVFHPPEVIQQRNVHNLQRDFDDEVPGYVGNDRLVAALQGLDLKTGPEGVAPNLLTCYQCLVAEELFPHDELPLVKSWLADLKGLGPVS